ncbi:MAG: hypothetical protein RIC03_12515 [Cyclobacteriaceae bacterium]
MSRLFSIKEIQSERAEDKDSSVHREKFLKTHFRKVESIKNLLGEFPAPGEAYFIYTLKSFNAFTFIVYILKHIGIIEELSFSTYSLNERILSSLIKWYDKGQLKSINIIISDSIRHRMPKVHDLLKIYTKDRNISVMYCWNHSKVTLIKSGDHRFVIEGSGNFSENAMHEQYLFMNNNEVFDFRYNGLMSFSPAKD